jgi:transposase
MSVHCLDLDKKTAFVHTYNEQTQCSYETRIDLDPCGIAKFVSSLKKEDVLCMEACHGSNYLLGIFEPAVSRVVLVESTAFGRIIDIKRHKTDRNDAGQMCLLYRGGALPTVWLANRETRDERTYAHHYRTLDEDRTRLRNRVHAHLTECGFGTRADELLKLDVPLLLAQVRVHMAELAYERLASNLRQLEVVESELRVAKARIVTLAEGRRAVEFARTLPGVDGVLGFIMNAVIGDIKRFENPDSLPNYAGVTPTLFSSGPGKPKHGSITKRGSELLRWAAVEAAQNAVRAPGQFKDLYIRLLRKGKHINVARVAVARKILTVLWHMLTTETPYRDVPLKSQVRKNQRRTKSVQQAQKLLAGQPPARESVQQGVGEIRRVLEAQAA